jgi:hypothetical protein
VRVTEVLFTEKLLRREPGDQAPLPLAAEGVQRYVWQSRFGEILIEVMGDTAFVNGQRVEPMEPTAPEA